MMISKNDQKNMTAIQACYRLTPENRSREISGLQAAMKKHKIKQGVVITYDDDEKITDQIHAVPFWKYFFMKSE